MAARGGVGLKKAKISQQAAGETAAHVLAHPLYRQHAAARLVSKLLVAVRRRRGESVVIMSAEKYNLK